MSQDKRAAKVTRGNRVHQVLKVLKGPLDSLDQLVPMVNLVPEGSKVSLARKVMKAQGVFSVPLVRLVFRGYLVLRVRKVKPEMSDQWVLLAHQDPEVHLDLQGPMVHKAPRGGLVIQDLWERRAILVNQVPQDLWDI